MEKQSGSGRRAREMRKYRRTELLILLLIIGILAVFFLVLYLGKLHKVWKPSDGATVTTEETEDGWEKKHIDELLKEAERIAQGYDFDGAINYLKSDELYKKTLVLLEKVEEIEKRKQDMVAWGDVRNITHIAVRPLIADPNKAFSAGVGADAYNQNYITTNEFRAILEELYSRGYVLVSLHDMASSLKYDKSLIAEETTEAESTEEEEQKTVDVIDIEVSETETESMEETLPDESEETIEEIIETILVETTTAVDVDKLKLKKIMLPEGKTPFVLSEENVCYTPELAANGFASKLVIKKDGSIACEMDDGNVGEYDLIPILEEFIKEHPDFSYCGARAVLGISGSDGVFGYKTSYMYEADSNYDNEVVNAKRVADKLKQLGYEFGMNGYHYANMGYASIDDETFKKECRNWFSEVATIVGTTDIIIFPNGDDIGDWRYYGGERYDFLSSLGFVYYLNMNATERAWNQILNYYMRQGRRMITGKLIAKEINGANNFTDIFDPIRVYDNAHLPIE